MWPSHGRLLSRAYLERSLPGLPLPGGIAFAVIPDMCVGAELAKARQTLGLSLEEIALRTKIPIERLSAIETADVAQLPAVVYLKGFLRAYAAEVYLDPDDITERYLAETDVAPPPDVVPEMKRLLASGSNRNVVETASTTELSQPSPAAPASAAAFAAASRPVLIIAAIALLAGFALSARRANFTGLFTNARTVATNPSSQNDAQVAPNKGQGTRQGAAASVQGDAAVPVAAPTRAAEDVARNGNAVHSARAPDVDAMNGVRALARSDASRAAVMSPADVKGKAATDMIIPASDASEFAKSVIIPTSEAEESERAKSVIIPAAVASKPANEPPTGPPNTAKSGASKPRRPPHQ